MNLTERQRERREIYLRRGGRISDLIREGYVRFGVHKGGKLNPNTPSKPLIISATVTVDGPKD